MNAFDKLSIDNISVESVKPSVKYSLHRNCSRFVRASRVRGSAAVLMKR